MPASRATASRSPLASVLCAIRSASAGEICTPEKAKQRVTFAPSLATVDDYDEDDDWDEYSECADLGRAMALLVQGNEFFKEGKLHDALEAYSEAFSLLPSSEGKEKAILFANRAA